MLDFSKIAEDKKEPEKQERKYYYDDARKTPGPKMIEGRPWRSDNQYDDSFPDMAYQVLAAGGSLSAVCAELKISRRTCLRWQDQFAEFAGACSAGLAASVKYWEQLGQDNLMTKDFNTKIWDKLLTTKERSGPDAVILQVDKNTSADEVAALVEKYKTERI